MGREEKLAERFSEPEEDAQSDQVQAVFKIQLVAIGVCRNQVVIIIVRVGIFKAGRNPAGNRGFETDAETDSVERIVAVNIVGPIASLGISGDDL